MLVFLFQVPSLQKLYTDLGYTFRDTLLTYLESQSRSEFEISTFVNFHVILTIFDQFGHYIVWQIVSLALTSVETIII